MNCKEFFILLALLRVYKFERANSLKCQKYASCGKWQMGLKSSNFPFMFHRKIEPVYCVLDSPRKYVE